MWCYPRYHTGAAGYLHFSKLCRSTFSMSKVFVTGANGFIAQHIVVALLERGYAVVGAVRSVAKGDALARDLGSKRFRYEVVPDFTGSGAFDKALQRHSDTDYVIHTASPVVLQPRNIDLEVLQPAVGGTVHCLEAVARWAPRVRKFVYTSSTAAITTAGQTAQTRLDEGSWSATTRQDVEAAPRLAYPYLKKLAEQAVWQFGATHNPRFALTTVNPPFVFGPQAFDRNWRRHATTSNSFITDLLGGEAVPRFDSYFVDVKALALAHVLALERPATDGHRLLVLAARFDCQQIADVIKKTFPQLQLPWGQQAYVRELPELDNTKTRALLPELAYKSLEETVEAVVRQVVRGEARRKEEAKEE